MDPFMEPDFHPHMNTKGSSEEEGASVAQFRGQYVGVDRDHQPIDVSSPFIDDWTEINSNDVSPFDSISCSDISELDLNDALEVQPHAPAAQDASDWDISSHQTQAKATPSVSDTSDLNSGWGLLSAEIWKTVHSSRSDIPDPNDVSEAQSTANTAHVASDIEYLADQALATATLLVTSRQRLAMATTSASNIPPLSRWEAANRFASNIPPLSRWEAANRSASNIPPRSRWEAANRSAYNMSSSQRWAKTTTSAYNISCCPPLATATTSASNHSFRQRQRWATATTSAPTQPDAYVLSTAVNNDPILPFNPIWYTPNSIRNFEPLPVPLPTYENGGLPSKEPSSSENLAPNVADDTLEPVQAVDPAVASGHVSPKIQPRRMMCGFVAAVRACLSPYFSF